MSNEKINISKSTYAFGGGLISISGILLLFSYLLNLCVSSNPVRSSSDALLIGAISSLLLAAGGYYISKSKPEIKLGGKLITISSFIYLFLMLSSNDSKILLLSSIIILIVGGIYIAKGSIDFQLSGLLISLSGIVSLFLFIIPILFEIKSLMLFNYLLIIPIILLIIAGFISTCSEFKLFISEYIFSIDHKWIGIQYGITSMIFLLFGFVLMVIMRYQLAYNVNTGLEKDIISPDMYNALGAMHGTIMVFLGVVPMVVGAFGNYLVPLQVGAPDMAFPKLNMASYWCYFLGGVVMLASFFIPDALPAHSGWTSYVPLSTISTGPGQTFWIVGMIFLIASSLLGSTNIIVTIVQLRVPGLTWMRLPFFVWTQLVTSFLLLLAFPPLQAAAIFQLCDRVIGTGFFDPFAGGSVLLYQHLFWFLAHPEVYVLILPALGIVAEIIANNIRKPLWGYKSMVYSSIWLGFMSFIVWAHHMFLTGMGTTMSSFFMITTMIISIPSVVILSALFLSLWGGKIRFNTPMLFALSFLPMFGIGGLTGLPLGLATADIHLHDTYYVIAHFHYVVAPGTIFAIFAGIYFWFPKITGKSMNEMLGKIHFWGSFICMNGIFMPMFLQGLTGLSRRMSNGGYDYAHAQEVLWLNEIMSISAFALFIFQLFFIFNFFWTILRKRYDEVMVRKWIESDPNPWKATTIEWTDTTSPPLGHGNFETIPSVYRGAYEYSVDNHKKDYYPQTEKDK